MERYIFSQIKVPRTKVMTSRENFNKVIDFCLQTRTKINNEELKKGKDYFNWKFKKIKKKISQGDWENLEKTVYSAPGVGQKIGSLILEAIIHYGEANSNLEKQLYVPIDTHVYRIFKECLGLKNVPEVNSSPYSKKYVEFQKYLAENTANVIPRIYFDYLWFVGKVFCTKIDLNKKGYSRGYRLCSMCWIKDYCILPNKWITL